MEIVSSGNSSSTSCSKQLHQLYRSWFDFADSDRDGRLTDSEATNFFSMSGLSKPVLKQVWAIADTKRQGFLGFKEFVTAMQMIYLAQEGHEISSDLLKRTVNLEILSPPNMHGLAALLENHRNPCPSGNSETHGNMQMQPAPPKGLFSSKSKRKYYTSLSSITSLIEGLRILYNEKLKPLEAAYHFHDFVSPCLTSSDFDAKTMVLLLGQYSTGKTTFIKHLLQFSYPGAHIRPEPTTDRFIAIMSGTEERSIPGDTITVHADLPFTDLDTFGGSLLSKFECSQMPHSLLEHITFVDTPGVSSGERQRSQTNYDFTSVISWFAAKCDMILLLFDPHKVDISDEFKRVISSLRGHDDKVRIVLNKEDQVDTEQLMRVHGSLMWSLGKVLDAPEAARVYIGSFIDKPVNEAHIGPVQNELFEKEQEALLLDLIDIPKKINEFVKHARAAKIHAYIISYLKQQMPTLMGKAKTQRKLINKLDIVFGKVQKEFHLPAADFPNVEQFREVLSRYKIDDFENLKPKMIQTVDDMLRYDIPELLKNFRNVED